MQLFAYIEFVSREAKMGFFLVVIGEIIGRIRRFLLEIQITSNLH